MFQSQSNALRSLFYHLISYRHNLPAYGGGEAVPGSRCQADFQLEHAQDRALGASQHRAVSEAHGLRICRKWHSQVRRRRLKDPREVLGPLGYGTSICFIWSSFFVFFCSNYLVPDLRWPCGFVGTAQKGLYVYHSVIVRFKWFSMKNSMFWNESKRLFSTSSAGQLANLFENKLC